MQKVNVKEVTIKKGTNAKGEWVNTRITDDDGAVFGTFAKGASAIAKGDLIELEPIIKGRNVNFEVWNMLEKGGSTSVPPLEAKKEYQPKVDNSASIEAQTAYKGIVELMVAKILSAEDILSKIALAWAKARLSESKQIKPEVSPKPDTKEPIPETKQPATPRGTMSWATFWKQCGDLGLDKEVILKILKVPSLKADWLEKGRTLEEALAILKSTLPPKGGS